MIDVVTSQFFCHDCGQWSLRMWATLARAIESADRHLDTCRGYVPRRVIHGDY